MPTMNDDRYELGFYMWMAGLDGTIGAGQSKDVAVDAKFTDIAQYVDFSMAGYFEARRPRYIVATDIFWVKLGATRTARVDGGPPVDVNLNSDQYVGMLGGAYRMKPDLDLWLSGRLYSFKNSATYQGSSPAQQHPDLG
jgi:hypothetical protein